MTTRRDLLGAGLFFGAATLVSGGTMAARSLQAQVPKGRDRTLENLPEQIDSWRLIKARTDMIDPIEIDTAFAAALSIYDRVVAKDYVSAMAPRIMVNMAYKRVIEQESRFHWPELCYATQGFQVSKLPPAPLGSDTPGVNVTRFIGERAERKELVCYLMRVGDSVTNGSAALRSSLFRQNFAMHVPDGTLARFSLMMDELKQPGVDSGTGVLLSFINGLLASTGPQMRQLLVA